MLRSNYIGMHATVMYRRSIFDSVGRFDARLKACEDYDLYLRIARFSPIYCHHNVVAGYRQHHSNMSRNPELMLKTSLSVLGSQWQAVKGNNGFESAYRAGVSHWQEYYGVRLARQVRSWAQAKEWRRALRGILVLLRYHPRGLATRAWRNVRQMVGHSPRSI
jgi:hypothetical protein